jgi:hypothetical protein
MNVLCIVAGEMKADLCENSQYLYTVETDRHSTIQAQSIIVFPSPQWLLDRVTILRYAYKAVGPMS